MPTVLRVGHYRFFFYSGDGDEPKHIHIERNDSVAKFWLNPIMLQRSKGFSRAEIARLYRIINDNHLKLLEAWNDYFTN